MNERLAFFQNNIGQSFDKAPSAVSRWLHGILREVEEGSAKTEFTVREDMTNPMGTLHGGIAATIMDDMIGLMVFALNRENAFTSININCDFLNPARVGDVLMAHAYVVRAGRNVIHCECRLTNEASGKIIAKASSNMGITHIKF